MIGYVAPMFRLVLLALLFGLALSGCGSPLSSPLARACRIALAGTVREGADLTVTAQSQRAGSGGTAVIRVEGVETASDGSKAARFAECVFDPHDAGTRPVLQAFRTDRQRYSGVALFFLQRFWIESPEGDRADPEPVQGEGRAWSLPYPVSYVLQSLVNAVPATSMYAALAVAYSLVYGLLGRINLAFGEMAAVGGAGALAGIAIVRPASVGGQVAAAALGGLWTAAVHGGVIGRAVFVPLRRSTGQQTLVATIGLALVLNEYLRLAQGPSPVWMIPVESEPHALARSGAFLVTLTPLSMLIGLCFAAVAATMLVLMHRTQFGRNWRALSDDPGAAALFGVDGTAVFGQTFALASALAGAAGAAAVLTYGSFGTTFGTVLGLKSLLAAVIGGIGSVPGALLGGLAVGGIEAVWSAYFPIEYRELMLYTLLVVTLVIRPGGFLGYRDLGPRRV
ncbi:MAG: branched-chain amino acid ABC transporter permease [Parafilimonas terrae]|nr:branched-chain amino acid ABC transporter permease [Parafilimonas terrae]